MTASAKRSHPDGTPSFRSAGVLQPAMLKEALHSVPAEWAANVADACLAVGTAAFGEALLAAANTITPVDRCIIVPFYRQAPADDLLMVGNGDLQSAARVMGDYATDGYRDDPYISYIRAEKTRPVVLSYSPQVCQEDYRKRFIEKLGIVDDVVCIAGRGDRVLYCNFVRLAPRSRYLEYERVLLGQISMILANLAAVHRTLCGPFSRWQQPGRVSTTPEHEVELLRQRLGHSSFDTLTERECEVCFRILLGYSSEAIGLQLGVARTTIMTYRKRAYEKLGIVSHYELFSVYLHSLPSYTPDSN